MICFESNTFYFQYYVLLSRSLVLLLTTQSLARISLHTFLNVGIGVYGVWVGVREQRGCWWILIHFWTGDGGDYGWDAEELKLVVVLFLVEVLVDVDSLVDGRWW